MIAAYEVETVIIDGQVVMEKRKIKTVHVKKALRQAQRATERLIRKLPFKLKPRWPCE